MLGSKLLPHSFQREFSAFLTPFSYSLLMLSTECHITIKLSCLQEMCNNPSSLKIANKNWDSSNSADIRD